MPVNQTGLLILSLKYARATKALKEEQIKEHIEIIEKTKHLIKSVTRGKHEAQILRIREEIKPLDLKINDLEFQLSKIAQAA